MCAFVFVWVSILNSCGYVPSSGVVVSYNSMFNFFWGLAKLFSTAAAPLYTPTSNVQASPTPTPNFLVLAIVVKSVLICISVLTNDAEDPCMFLLLEEILRQECEETNLNWGGSSTAWREKLLKWEEQRPWVFVSKLLNTSFCFPPSRSLTHSSKCGRSHGTGRRTGTSGRLAGSWPCRRRPWRPWPMGCFVASQD